MSRKGLLGEPQGYPDRAQHYHERATKLRAMAEANYDEKSRKGLLTLADLYDKLVAELLDPAPRFPKQP